MFGNGSIKIISLSFALLLIVSACKEQEGGTTSPATTPAPSASATPAPLAPGSNQVRYVFTCACDEGKKEVNCGVTSSTGQQCDCPPQPPPSSCTADGSTTINYYCMAKLAGESCVNGAAPNSFSPTLQKGQCRVTYIPKWGASSIENQCKPGFKAPNAANLKPVGNCTVGQKVTKTVNCTCS